MEDPIVVEVKLWGERLGAVSEPGRWTRQHQMLVAGKAQGIGRNDLVELGTKFSVRRVAEKYERVLDALRRWPEFAQAAGVGDEAAADAARYQELG